MRDLKPDPNMADMAVTVKSLTKTSHTFKDNMTNTNKEGFQKKTVNHPHFVDKRLTPPPLIHFGRS